VSDQLEIRSNPCSSSALPESWWPVRMRRSPDLGEALDGPDRELARERELVLRAQRRDDADAEAAFAQIVDRLGGRILAQILNHVGNEARARELLQETFIRAYQALPRYRPEARLRTWVGRIAQNLCVDEARRQAAGRGQVLSLDDPGTGSGLGLVATLSGGEGDAQAQAIEAEERARVQAAVAELRLIHREIVTLRVYEGLSYAEIAEIVGCGEAAARQRMHQATRLLRDVLSESGEE